MNCKDCVYAELIAKQGDHYSTLNAVGFEVENIHTVSLYRCREGPPINDIWPTVLEDDWCGRGKNV